MKRFVLGALLSLTACGSLAQAQEVPAAYKAVLGGHPKLSQTIFEHGTTVFPRLAEGDGDHFFQRITEKFETSTPAEASN